MENKIVYLKTYIITIAALIILCLAALGGMAYYYEGKIKELKNTINPNQSGITIVQNVDTNVNDVKAE